MHGAPRDGDGGEVPPAEGNGSPSLRPRAERWSGGRIRASRACVLGTDAERSRIAYFTSSAVRRFRPLAIDRPGPRSRRSCTATSSGGGPRGGGGNDQQYVEVPRHSIS